MQSSKSKIIILAALIAGAAFYFSSKRGSSGGENLAEGEIPPVVQSIDDQKPIHNHSADITAAKPTETSAPKSTYVPVVIAEDELSEFKSLSSEEKKSLLALSGVMAEAASPDSTMNKIVDKLAALNIRPVVMKDSNPYTGTMNVVRTKDFLPGTRYFHAQYFSDNEGNDETLQHMSFELKPSKDAFAAAKKVAMKQFNITVKPTSENDKMIIWNVGNDVVWIKQLDAKDVKKANPYNSYDPVKDVGTVKFVRESEIH
jgi:hypothetical protein